MCGSHNLVLLAVIFALPASVYCSQVAVEVNTEANPMRKIISMLQDMAKEVEREGEVEAEIYEKALCACDGGEKNLQGVIAESQAAIEEQTSKNKAQTAEKAQLTQEVEEHKTNKFQAEQDLAEATELRDKEHATFVAEEKDSKTNLAGLSKAIPAIEKGMAGAALMQVPHFDHLHRYVEVTKLLSSDERAGVLAFFSLGDGSGEQVQAPGSGEILGILKSMKDEMAKDLAELKADEQKALEGFNDLKSAKSTEIETNEKAIVTKEKRMGALAVEISESTHALEDATEELANAQKFLANMAEECANKAKEKDIRAKMRLQEITAINEAVGILNDDEALDTFKKTASSLVQQPRQTYDALLQVAQRHRTLLHAKVKQHADSQSEQEPVPVAEEMVDKLITGMVSVLHDQDVTDEHKKDWCVNETEVSHKIEAEKKSVLEQVTAEIADQEDQVATLSEEIKGLIAKINDLDKTVHELSVQRKSEHQEFVDNFATSGTAIRLIDKAIKRLEKFYSPEKYASEKKAAEDAALKKAGFSLLSQGSKAIQKKEATLLPGGFDFLQVSAQSMSRIRKEVREGVDPVALPDTPSGKVQKSESGGVMGLMNDFKTDLKTDMVESETEEKFNAKEYVRMMGDAQETRAQDTKSLNQKKAEKASLDEKLLENKELKDLTEQQLHNLELYLVQLHTECDFLTRNFDVRHDDRVEEETGLESAKTIVTEGTPPSHREIEKRYDEEHTAEDVDEHFPDTPGKL